MENKKPTPSEWMLKNLPDTQILSASEIGKHDLIFKMRKYVFGGNSRLEPVSYRVVRVTRNTLQIQQSDGYTKFITKIVNGKERKFVVRKEI